MGEFTAKISGVTVHSDNIHDKDELREYVKRGLEKYGKKLLSIRAHADGGDVELEYETAKGVPFIRIRRITGYLVGGMERWNDGKRAEEKDRVKHGMEGIKDEREQK